MASTLRYLLACKDVEDDGGLLVLRHVADTVFLPHADFPCEIVLCAVLGLHLERPAWNKRVDLLSWRLGKRDGQKVALVHVKNGLFLPEVEGFTSVSFKVSVPIDAPGVFGFDLIDGHGVFGVSTETLATFTYGVDYLD